MNCQACSAYMGEKQKVCGDCGWIKGQQSNNTGIGCQECHLSNPSVRRYHWLSIPAADLGGHLAWIADNITRSALIHDIHETRKRYSNRSSESGRLLEPCDAWRETMIAAQKEQGIELYTQHHIQTHDLFRREGESATSFHARCKGASKGNHTPTPTAKQVTDYDFMESL